MASFKAPSTIPSRRKKPELPVTQPGEKTAECSGVESGQVQSSVTEDRETAGSDGLTQKSGLLEEGGASDDCTTADETKGVKESTNLKPSPAPGAAETTVVPSGTPPLTPSLPYTEPHWSGTPPHQYYLTVIKSGSVVEEIDVSHKPFQVFGRLPICDIPLEHPSISRYHAVLQYRPSDAPNATQDEERGEGSLLSLHAPNETGFYVYDLNSTHGSFLNKSKLQPRVYYRVRVGQMVRFGGSSRLFVLEVGSCSSRGGQEVVEAEAEAEIRELQREKEAWLAREKRRLEERERLAREREEMGATWGMVMDEVQQRENEEEELTLDPEREAYYKDDPKKALTKYFDREGGLELEYDVEEEGSGRDKTYIARVTLPIESGGGGGGEMLVVEERVRGKKKEAIVQCALKACRILDSNDMLHPASKRRQRLSKNWEENDFYDSDEDSFLDRTGELEQKRRQRMKRLGKLQEQAESYDSLETKLKEVRLQKQSIEAKLSKSRTKCQGGDGRGGDSLDEYMSVVSSQLDPATVTRLKKRALDLGKEESRMMKLLKIAKPTELPSIHTSTTAVATDNSVQSRLTADPPDPPAPPAPLSLTSPPPAEKDSSTIPQSPQLSSSRRTRRHRRRSSSSGDGGGGTVGPDKKRPRVLGPALPPQSLRDMSEKEEAGAAEDPNFASWLPPENQTGDGRTHLNEKYGY